MQPAERGKPQLLGPTGPAKPDELPDSHLDNTLEKREKKNPPPREKIIRIQHIDLRI